MSMILLTLLLALMNTVGEKDQFMEILIPHKFISTNSYKTHIVGKTSAPIIEVYINDQKTYETMVKDSIFHQQIFYGAGLNEVRIKAIYSGMIDYPTPDAIIEILAGPEIKRKYKKIYTPYKFHDSTPKDFCICCHDCDCDNLEETTDKQICLTCHKDYRENFSKHTKVENRTCVLCHQLDLTTFESADIEDNPCFKCHDDRIGFFTREYVHGPVAGGSCTICHNPHGSKYEKSLQAPVQILCFTCHEYIEDEQLKKTVHDPFMSGHCEKCHDPHSTNNRWVLVKNSQEVCMGCHNPDDNFKWHSHPYNVKPKKDLVVDLKLTSRGQLECLSCHNPHSTNTEHLLRITNPTACLGCHMDKE